MHIATVVLSVLLAVEFAFTGLIKMLGTATARANAEHLGISLRLSRLIGVAELAAVVGLLAGI
ncbi:DoxX family protein, partial [Mycobacterium sp.]